MHIIRVRMRSLHGLVRGALAAVVLVSLAAGTAFAAPRPDLLGQIWTEHDAGSTRTVDNSLWAEFLDRYLVADDPSGVNLVRYADVTDADKASLDRYIRQLEAIDVRTLNRDEQLAYWLNMYNAVTVQVILDHYPVRSIRRIGISGFFSIGPWDADLVEVLDEPLTLNEIEHRIIRPIWTSPLIHYVVNCASYSCPELAEVPFTAENVYEIMEESAVEYVNHPRGVEIDGRVMRLSSIYTWYMQDDFGGNREGLIEHLLQYASPQKAREIRDFDGRLAFSYDWALNEPD